MNKGAADFPEHHFLPSIPATIFVGILAFTLFGFQESLLNSDGDLARHLRHGQYMLQHRALIRLDPFSFSRPGEPFVAFEYGSQLVLALIHRAGGLAAVTVWAGILIGGTYALLARFMLRRGVEPLLAALVTGAAMISGMSHWVARPHLFTMVAVVLLLSMLRPTGQRRTWTFVPLFALWANLHGGFIYGLTVIGIFAFGAASEAILARDRAPLRDARFYALALVASILGTLIHPRALAVYRHIFWIFDQKYILDHTNEFLSPNFHDAGTKIFLFVMLGAIAAVAASRTRPSVTSLILLLAGIYFALVHQRNATLFGLTALPMLAVDLGADWRSLGWLRAARHNFEAAARGAATLAWVVPALLLAGVLGAKHGRVASHQLISDRFSSKEFPVRAMELARAAALPGPVFAEFAWGGYMLYAWPEQKVFIDGGADFYGGNIMREYGTIYEDLPGWQKLIQRWGFAVLIVPPKAPIATEIEHDGGWRYWYCDSTAVVIVRNDVAQASSMSPTFNRSSCPQRAVPTDPPGTGAPR
jgi:hypothetical protein